MLRRHARKIDAFQGRWGIGVSWLMLGMVLVVFGDVIFRYLFNKSWVFIQELEWHLFGLVYLLAAGYTMLHNEHVRVDIWYAKQSARSRRRGSISSCSSSCSSRRASSSSTRRGRS